MKESISARAEDYLETVWWLCREGGGAHTTDIAERLDVRKASVTEALQSLAKKGLVNYDRYMAVTLTKAGEKLARDVSRRHEVLRRFLTDVLCIKEAKADEEACKLEHALSRQVTERLIAFTEFMETCPRAGHEWVRGLSYQCSEIDGENRCRACIEQCLTELDERQGNETERKMMTADQMKRGERGRIVKLSCKGALAKRMADMGVVRGATLEVKRIAPMGDPIEFKVKGYHLSLRKEEAAGIDVEVEQ